MDNEPRRSAGRSLLVAGCVLASVTGYMAYAGASSSWQYYLTVDECLLHQQREQDVRVSGTIAPGSLHISPERDEAVFTLQGATGELRVTCAAPLPDNLQEEVEVVAEGRIGDAGEFEAHKVLTRCASKYASRDREAPLAEREE